MKKMLKIKKKALSLLMLLVLLCTFVPASVAETYSAYVNANSTPVYSDMAMKTKVATLSKWKVLTVLNESGGVAAVRYNGTMCYMSSKALDSVEANAQKASVNADTKVYEKAATSSRSVAIGRGTTVNLVATSGEWALIEKNGNSGFCQKKYITVTGSSEPQAIISATVTTPVDIYTSASTTSKKKGALGVGAQVKMLAVSSGWARIEMNGISGYCSASALTPSSQVDRTALGIVDGSPAVVTASSVKVYGTASTSGKLLGTIKKGTSVSLITKVNDWAFIEMAGNYGYCAASAISTGTETSTQVIVTASSCKVYQSSSTSSKLLGTVKKGTVFNRKKVIGDWSYVEMNGNYGYCKSSDIKERTAALSGFKTESFSATVVATGEKFYSSNSTSSSSTPIGVGTTVVVGAYSKDWAYCKNGSSYGFIRVKGLSRQNYTTLTSANSGTAVKSLQGAMLVLGYYDGPVNGTWNDAIPTAVKRVQSAMGMTVTGKADTAFLRVLYGSYVPKDKFLSGSYASGMNGANVTRIQTRLYALKYLGKSSSLDGDYGTTTAQAIALFEAANGLTKTGKASGKTLEKLYSVGAAALPSGAKPADNGTAAVSPDPITGGNQVANSTHISSTLASKTSTFSASMNNKQKLEYIIYVGQNQLGKRYVFGATGTATFDCSGFTMYSFKQGGVSLLRTAYQQGYNDNYKKITSVSSLRRGDLVFFNTVSDSDACDHVGIYLGAGWFIHASSGQAKVVVSNITSGYYNRVFSWGRRILNY